MSKPVKSQFGWHIIRKVNEAKAGTPLDKLPADLRAIVESDAGENALTAYIAELKAKADIEYVDETLKPE
jgi:parvulin-like peptidyl-prolyl isomerase